MRDNVIKTSKGLDAGSKIRGAIMEFETMLSKQPGAFFGDTSNCPLTHKFAEGIYVREIFIPEGTYIVGKIHKHAHPNFLMSGTVDVMTEGGGLERLVGPLSMISPPGTKRALKAITDLVWITVHHNPANTRDLVELEKRIIAESYEDFNKFIKRKENWFTKLLLQLKLIKL